MRQAALISISMKFLIVGLKENPQLKRLQEEGKKRHHQVDGCLSADLLVYAGNDDFLVKLKDGRKLTDYDLIYLWAMGKRRWEWYLAAYLLGKEQGVQIVNEKVILEDYFYCLTPAADYLKQTSANISYPKSVVFFPGDKVEDKIKLSFPMIVKTSGGRQGRGVYKVNNKEELKWVIEENKEDKTSLVARELIPNDGDIRVFTVGYRAIGAMKRTPKKGEFRSNISQGGSGEEFDMAQYPQVRNIAEELSRITKTEIAGVDIMIHQKTKEPYVLEINPGPQFTGLEKYTSANAALEIIKYFETKVSSGK